jgi:hypothetical protein
MNAAVALFTHESQPGMPLVNGNGLLAHCFKRCSAAIADGSAWRALDGYIAATNCDEVDADAEDEDEDEADAGDEEEASPESAEGGDEEEGDEDEEGTAEAAAALEDEDGEDEDAAAESISAPRPPRAIA